MFGNRLKYFVLVMILLRLEITVNIGHVRGNWFPHSPYFPSPAKNYPDYVASEFEEVDFTQLEKNPLEWPKEITTSKGQFRMKSLHKMSWEEDEIYIDHTYPAELWDNGVVNFVLLGNFSRNFRRHLALVFKYIQESSCIKFTQYNDSLSCGKSLQLLRIFHTENSNQCAATVGFNGLNSRMEIDESVCTSFSDLAHLTFHVLGFDHEFHREETETYVAFLQSFPEDKYRMLKSMRKPTYRYMPYNPYSLLHMDSFQYAPNNHNHTLLALYYEPENEHCPFCKYGVVRKGNDLHPLDMNNLNLLYHCRMPNCSDQASRKECYESGQSRVIMCRNSNRNARCAERHPALLKCAITCGLCHHKGQRKRKVAFQ